MERIRLNGVDIERIQSLTREMQDDPTAMSRLASSIWKSRIMWRTNFQAFAFARELSPITLDQPDWLGGDNMGFSPHEVILSAIGASVAVVFVTNATALGVDLESLEIEVDGELDLTASFGMSSGASGFQGIGVKVFVKSGAPSEVLEMVQEKAMALSPVVDTIRRPVRVTSGLKIVP